MAVQTLSKDPTALGGSSNIPADTAYTVQFKAAYRTYVQVATTAPTNAEGAFVVAPMGYATVSRTGTQKVYVWQDERPAYGVAVFDPAV